MFQIEADTNEFVRRLRQREYFHGRDDNTNCTSDTAISQHPPDFRKHNNNNWTPHSGHNTYLDSCVIKEEIGKFQKPKLYSNITREKEALSELRSRANRDIVIMPADKGGGTCTQSRNDYIAEANRQFRDPLTYKPLNRDITNKLNKCVENIVMGMKRDNVNDDKLI